MKTVGRSDFRPPLVARLPAFEAAELVEGWAGLYEMTPDHNPLLGEHPELAGFHLANGFSGHGLMMAPATGAALAELLTTGASTRLDIGAFDPGRFARGEDVPGRCDDLIAAHAARRLVRTRAAGRRPAGVAGSRAAARHAVPGHPRAPGGGPGAHRRHRHAGDDTAAGNDGAPGSHDAAGDGGAAVNREAAGPGSGASSDRLPARRPRHRKTDDDRVARNDHRRDRNGPAPRKPHRDALVDECLATIADRDPALNAFIAVLPDDARRQARVLDGELARGIDRGPLHGIPISLKDIIDLAGTPTTAASRVRAGHRAAGDAPVAARLRAAGAVFIGKCNLHEFAFGTTGEESAFGPTRNPHAPAHVPGGSSSGSAVSVAAGMALASIGTDTGEARSASPPPHAAPWG